MTTSDRAEALSSDLYAVRESFRQKWGVVAAAPVHVIP